MSDADLLDPPVKAAPRAAPQASARPRAGASDADLLDPPPARRPKAQEIKVDGYAGGSVAAAAPEQIRVMQDELAKEKDPVARQALQREIARLSGTASPKAPLPSAAAPAATLATMGQIPTAPTAAQVAAGAVVPQAPPAQQEWTRGQASLGDKLLGGAEVLASGVTGTVAGYPLGVLNMADNAVRRGLSTLGGLDTSQMPTTEQAFTQGVAAGTYQPRIEEGRGMMQDIAGSETMRALTALAPLRQFQLATASVPARMVARDVAGKVGSAGQTVADQFKTRQPLSEAARVEPTMAPKKPVYVVRDGKIVLKEPVITVDSEGVAVVGEARAGAAPATVEARSMSQPWRGNAAEGVANAPPELQAAITKAEKAGTLNPAAARRQIQAATLDVPVQLSKGHATLDARLLSEEMNGRAGRGVSVTPEFLQQQARDLAQNLDVRRQIVAPDVTTTNPTQHGQALIDAAKRANVPERAAIKQAYDDLIAAAGGDLPVDGAAFVASADAALKKQLKSGAVPASIRSVMDDYKSGRQMTFEEFETLRTDLAQIMRDSGSGSERAAAKIIRKELEALPLTPEAAQLKPLADKARGLNDAWNKKLEADPAYEAAVTDRVPIGDESPLADVFVDKYLIGGRRANIGTFQQNLASDPLGRQTMAAATVDFLRTRAKADVEAGKFNADAYRNTLQRVGPKLDVLLDPESAAKLQQVGDVAGYVTIQPRGSFVNNSNTLVGAAGEAGANAARSFLAIKTLGASEGAISAIQSSRAARRAKASVAPGAGVDTGGKLSDLGKP